MPKFLTRLFAIPLWIYCLCNSFIAFADQPRFLNTSIVSLIANPEKYEGKKISVVGFLHIGFEDTAIYLHQDDYQNNITGNGFWASLPNSTDSISDFPGGCKSNQYVRIIGTFSTEFKGHMGAWGGSIKNVENCNSMLKVE